MNCTSPEPAPATNSRWATQSCLNFGALRCLPRAHLEQLSADWQTTQLALTLSMVQSPA